MKAAAGSGALQIRLRNPERRPEAERLLALHLGVPVSPATDPAELSARVSDPERVTHVLSELTKSGIQVMTFSFGQPSLDEVFLTLTGSPAKQARTNFRGDRHDAGNN